jgi:hypothetical protein
MSITVELSFHLANVGERTGGFRRVVRQGAEPTPAAPVAPISGRIPRIAKLMALAIRCDQLLRSGTVPDASALAKLAHVSQPRMTQILNLTLLRRTSRMSLLFLPLVEEGKPEISEKGMRRVCREMDWRQQRKLGGCAD